MLANGLMKGASTRIGMSMASLPVTLAPHRLQLSRNVSAPAYEGLPPPAGRTFTQYSIYKGKAAVAFKAIAPTFRQNQNDFAVDREGVLLLEFAQVLPNQGNQSSYGARTYDWKNKVTFALKALELAQLTDLDNLPDPSKGVDLFHDPNKGNPDAANSPKVSKAFKFAYAPSGEGYMMSISQKIGAQNSFVSVPVTRAEFVVLKHLAAYLIPRMYGFDYLFEGQGAVPANLVEAEAVLQ